jgi:adenylate cyclase
MEPEALVEVLHEYLNPMSEIVVKHGGTLDKYIGDAIMALYGAPLEQTDHSRRACRTALEMVQTLKELDREWVERGRPALRIGIGINSGLVSVGNMGSNRLFDYTAIGDNVNLASRLEGLNKYYGTNILISETTAKALENGFILRDIDMVRVKGKAQTARIYELLGEGEPEPELARFLELYHRALALYREKHWAESLDPFAQALEVHPGDGTCQHYVNLARRHHETPPAPDWEAVTVMDGK